MAGKTSPLARQSSTSTYDNDVNARRKRIPLLGQDTFDSPQVFFDPAKERCVTVNIFSCSHYYRIPFSIQEKFSHFLLPFLFL
jgi:hypothetical protein